jgi:hypothetical protein
MPEIFRLGYLFYPRGFIVRLVALAHFFRRRPDGFWLWVIFFVGFLGALVYIVAEMLPDAGVATRLSGIQPQVAHRDGGNGAKCGSVLQVSGNPVAHTSEPHPVSFQDRVAHNILIRDRHP